MPKSFVAVLSLVVGLFSSQVLAETYTYNGGDVTQATSFSPEGMPGAGDTILIPAETDLVITSSTPGWDAVAALGSSGHIVPLAATSRLVLNVAEAESSTATRMAVGLGVMVLSPNLDLLTIRRTMDSESRLGILAPRSVPLLTRRQRICRLSSASIPRRQARSRVGII